MKITDVTQKHNTVSFNISDTTPAFVNAVRRSAISLVPVLAVETVEIVQNTSALYDEVLAHRLGMLPLTTDLVSYKLTQIADDVFRPESQVKLTLEAKGPGVVCAEQIVSKDPSVKCAEPKMPIVKLLEGQEVQVVMTAQMGQGVTHMKWSPGATYYQYAPEGKAGSTKALLDTKSAEIEPSKDVTRSEKDFVFTVESWGQLPPKDIVLEAITQLDAQLDALHEAAK